MGFKPPGWQGPPPPDYAVLFGFACGVIGLIFVFFGGLAVLDGVARYVRKERLILGKTFLQCIFDKDKAAFQIPYDNIADIRLRYSRTDIIAAMRNDPALTSYVVAFIGIDLSKRKRKDTILNPGLEKFGFDLVIHDIYAMPLDELFEKLVKRWTKATQRGAAEQRDDALAYRRRHRIGQAVGYFVVGIFALNCCILPMVGLIAYPFVKRPAIQAPAPPAAPGMPPVGPGRVEAPPAAPITGDGKLDSLLADLDSGDLFKRRKAAEQLSKMEPNEHRATVAAKLAAMNDKDSVERIRAIGVWATPTEIPVLTQALDGSNPFVSEAALKYLGKLNDERCVAPVVRYLEKNQSEAAKQALRNMGAMAEPAVLPLLQHQSPFVALAAVDVLKDIGTEASIKPLQAFARDPKRFRAEEATKAVAAIKTRVGK
jgi:hypothetical protein